MFKNWIIREHDSVGDMGKTRILIADNHTLVREGVKAVLSTNYDFEVVGEVEAGNDLLPAISRIQPDVIIIDFDLPGFFDISHISSIYANYPHANVLVVTTNQQKENILKVLECGVNNYILKLCDKDEFIAALYATCKKERFFCGKVIDAILEKQLEKPENCEGIILSAREIEIVKFIAEGYTNSSIAEKLFLSVYTVGTHRKNIFKKLGLNKSSDVILYAIKNGLVNAGQA